MHRIPLDCSRFPFGSLPPSFLLISHPQEAYHKKSLLLSTSRPETYILFVLKKKSNIILNLQQPWLASSFSPLCSSPPSWVVLSPRRPGAPLSSTSALWCVIVLYIFEIYVQLGVMSLCGGESWRRTLEKKETRLLVA